MQNIAINTGGEMNELYNSAFIITDSNLERIYGSMLPKNRFAIQAGENNKTLYSVDKAASEMLKCGVKRSDKIVAFGGGLVGDITGFLASVYMRGIKWSFVPTSLLAMADSCVGGKTGVNVGLIKNAVGSFYMPDGVFIEVKYLNTLPRREYESGLGEIVKMSLIDAELYRFMHGKFDVTQAIRMCIKIKSDIVDKDFKDNGARKVLNMGHTVGHAIEMMTGISHGKSVLIGLRLELLMLRDLIEHNFFYEIQSYLNRFIGKAPMIPDAEAITVLAMSDKKNSSGISVMYPRNIGDIREIVLDKSEFLRLLKGAL